MNIEEIDEIKFEIDKDEVNRIIKTYSRLAKQLLREKSPERREQGKHYKEGFDFELDPINMIGVVYNKKLYRLSHLLENGHFILNKKGHIGWASPRPHFQPTFDEILPYYLKDMSKVKVGVKVKRRSYTKHKKK